MSGADEGRRRALKWLWRLPVVVTVVGGGFGLWRALRVHLGKVVPVATPSFRAVPPVPIATVEEFDTLWSAATFTVHDTPAIAVHVPKGVAGGVAVGSTWIAGFSRVCTHQGCLVNLNTSPAAIALATNYRADGPALVCPCHLSVFLPTRQGEAVAGPAVRPLPRLRLDVVDGAVIATGIERSQEG